MGQTCSLPQKMKLKSTKLQLGIAVLACAAIASGAVAVNPKKPAKSAVKAKKRRYRSSVGKRAPKTAAASAKKSPATTAAHTVHATTAATLHRTAPLPR